MLFMSSVGGTIPLTEIGSYSASKAYVDFLARALSFEVRDKVDVLSMRPGEIKTKLNRFREGGEEPDIAVKLFLRDLGSEIVTNGTLLHEMIQIGIDYLYPWFPNVFTSVARDGVRDIRRRIEEFDRKNE
jgi:NAD(P)-dependent dehydrogenase (short-subunit alcohol dehydrogenase family)